MIDDSKKYPDKISISYEKTFRPIIVLIVAISFSILLFATSAAAMADSIATVSTDQSAYLPESLVTITGVGFVPSSNVTISVTDPNNSVMSWNVPADGVGSFTTSYQLDGINGTYYLTASDGTNSASTSFLDATTVDFNGLASTGSTGTNKTTFTTVEDVYANITTRSLGNNPPVSDATGYVYVNASSTCAQHGTLTDVSGGAEHVDYSTGGSFLVQVWHHITTPGHYVLVVDANESGGVLGRYDNSKDFCVPFTIVTSASPLTISKTAVGSFDQTYSWNISKSVDATKMNISSANTATFHYTVNVTHDGGNDSAWIVNGNITVTNPNAAVVAGVNVTDAINDSNAVCTVIGGNEATLPASSSSKFAYICTYSSAPSATNEKNNGTATWNTQTLSNGALLQASSVNGSATVNWATVNATVIDGGVSVTDSLNGTLGKVNYTEASPKIFNYTHKFSGIGGTCTNYDNTATFTTNSTGKTNSASQTVTVCVGEDLQVTKNATASFDRQFMWNISKTVDHNSTNTINGAPATFNYTVTVTHNAGNDSNWKVNGTIHVVNPNDWESITANFNDTVNDGGTCTVTSLSLTIPKSGSVDNAYICTYSTAPNPSAGMNTANVTWDKNVYFTPKSYAIGTATFDFSTVSPNLIDECVNVTDSLNGTLGTACVSDVNPGIFHYKHTFNDPVGTCTSHDNTATFTTNDTHATKSAKQTVTDCQSGSSVTSSSFCNVTGTPFRLIYIQDTGSGFSLQASNPGQFYYNLYYVSSTNKPAGTVITAKIPYPFVTQGANPIQVFENKPLPVCGSTVPSTNVNSMFTINPKTIALSAYGASPVTGSTNTTVTFTLTSPLPKGNLLWFAIHLDYGLKGQEFTKISLTTAPCVAPNTGDCAVEVALPHSLISNPQSYTFSNDVTGSLTPTSVNHFNKDPGFAGVVTKSDNTPISGATVKITLNGKLVATVSTNDDGVYMYQYKYTGSSTTWSITASYPGTTPVTKTGTIKSNQMVVTNFTLT